VNEELPWDSAECPLDGPCGPREIINLQMTQLLDFGMIFPYHRKVIENNTYQRKDS
jgi:hypothetical protein